VLVIDLDGEPLAPLPALEEILLCLGTWEDDDRRDPSTDTELLLLPAPLADRVPRRRSTAAHRPGAHPVPGNRVRRLLAPNGR
jgi:hypothetical protein